MSEAHTPYIEISGKEAKIRLRKSLFWDVPANSLDLDKNKKLILERVFTRGEIEEFQSVNGYYSRKEIRETVKKIGQMDKKTLQFISRIYQIKLGDFKCYKKNL